MCKYDFTRNFITLVIRKYGNMLEYKYNYIIHAYLVNYIVNMYYKYYFI